MIEIDGSEGEGGGQILRSAIGLALATGQPFRIVDIRKRRERPGLMRQHLTCVEAACRVGGAEVVGAELGSMRLELRPGRVRPGDYELAIGTAGSTTLVAQSILPGLLVAEGKTRVVLTGGTHNPLAPPFEAFARVIVPFIAAMGGRVTTSLGRVGFAPAGGGRLTIEVEGVGRDGLRGVDRMERGRLVRADIEVLLASVPWSVGQREIAALTTALEAELSGVEVTARAAQVSADSPGNALFLTLVFEHAVEFVSELGARGVSSEMVAERVADRARALLASGAAVGEHTQDQLPLLMALAGGGRYRTVAPTDHFRSQATLVPRFTGGSIVDEPVAADQGAGVIVSVYGPGSRTTPNA